MSKEKLVGLHKTVSAVLGDLKVTDGDLRLTEGDERKWTATLSGAEQPRAIGIQLVATAVRLSKSGINRAVDQLVLLAVVVLGSGHVRDSLERSGIDTRKARDLVARAEVAGGAMGALPAPRADPTIAGVSLARRGPRKK